LLGLDHPLMQQQLARWRSLPPEDIGIAVRGDADPLVLLSFWLVESSAGSGDRRVSVQVIAVKPDGTRVPSIERQGDRYLRAPVATPVLTTDQRLEVFYRVVEPTLLRELKHKSGSRGDGGYSAELVGYAEVCAKV
jgi:hypothetical protein